jgi:branched-chain amino acid transport system ATP-binding protein
LELDDVHSGYGRLTILHGVSLEVRPGEMVGLLGRNGAGKTTLAKTIMGAVRVSDGTVKWDGRRINGMRTERIVKLGISIVPQSRGLFMGLTVAENLLLSCVSQALPRREVRAREAEMYERFEALGRRRDVPAASLSGGEQQMLAIAKALIRRPQLLILDEPSTGLAPKVLESIGELVATLRSPEFALVLAEQNVTWALGMVDVAYVLDQGQVAERMDTREASLDERDALLASYLGAGTTA